MPRAYELSLHVTACAVKTVWDSTVEGEMGSWLKMAACTAFHGPPRTVYHSPYFLLFLCSVFPVMYFHPLVCQASSRESVLRIDVCGRSATCPSKLQSNLSHTSLRFSVFSTFFGLQETYWYFCCSLSLFSLSSPLFPPLLEASESCRRAKASGQEHAASRTNAYAMHLHVSMLCALLRESTERRVEFRSLGVDFSGVLATSVEEPRWAATGGSIAPRKA